MQTLSEIRALLAARGLRPRHRLGQNFLHDKNQLRKLLDAASVQPGDLVLEVGPGTGTLTETLLEAGAELIVVELDEQMASIVEERNGDALTLIRGDCLQTGRALNETVVAAIAGRPFKLVANLPYQVASPLMCALLIAHPNCLGQYVTIQLEVADRLLARPSTKAYGSLSIIVQSLGEVKRIATVPAGCFWPAPKVTSAMVGITPRADHGIDDPSSLARWVTTLFSSRRKQLGSIFGRDGVLPDGLDATLRPEALDVAALTRLWRHLER